MIDATTARQLAQTVVWETNGNQIEELAVSLLAKAIMEDDSLFSIYMRAYSQRYRMDWKEAERQAMIGATDAPKGGRVKTW